MSDRTRVTLEIIAILLVALVFTAAPGGDSTLQVILAILSIGFFVAIALLGYRLYRENTFALESLTDVQRGVLYSCVGGAFLVFAAAERLFDWGGGGGVVIWIALLGLCSYGIFWVWQSSRDYA
jgi:TRAP-type C4-dicarboxylate transport system permease small subunit